MALQDIAGAPDGFFPGLVGANIPSPNFPRSFAQPFRTANGYLVEVTNGWPAVVVRWVEDAFNACGYDVARLWCIRALFVATSGVGNVTAGEVNEPRFVINPVPASSLPDFPQDYVNVRSSTVTENGRIDIDIWDGLPGNALPFGGRRFFMESVLHGIGHVVGSYFAAGADLFKKFNLCLALAADRISGEYGGMNGFGYGFAWKLWDDTTAAGTSAWALRPQERFAECFKDIWGLASARTFLNRTEAKRINVQAIIDEAQVYLPINGVDTPPHIGGGFGWRGVSMSQKNVPARSIVTGCTDVLHPCFDPKTGLGPEHCVGCWADANEIDNGHCGNFYNLPLSDSNYDVIWSLRATVPKIGFCRNTYVTYGQPRAQDGVPPRNYQCPGVAGVGANYSPVGVFLQDSPPVHVDGTHIQVDIRHGLGCTVDNMPVSPQTFFCIGIVNSGVSFMVHTEPAFTYDGKTSDIDIVSGGWAAMDPRMFRVPDSFNFMADQFYVDLGYHHIPGLECRMRAPSEGITSNPYAQLNLDGFAQGGARTMTATGQEAAVEELALGPGAPADTGVSVVIGGT